MVDLETVSIFPPENLLNVAKDENKYKNTPFLYLVSSYVRNKSLDWAQENFNYAGKVRKGSWTVYCFGR